MNKELGKLLKYCKDNNIKVVFTDSTVLHDYAALNPEAARAMGFPDYDGDEETKEVLIDKEMPEETQVANLKHELIEFRLMRNGMPYWDAHLISLRKEKEPFDFSKSIPKINMVQVGKYDNGTQEPPIMEEDEKPKKKGWHRRFFKPKQSIVKGG